jgi:hypothetical protein
MGASSRDPILVSFVSNMETFTSFFYIVAGFLLRLAIPVAATILIVFFLRRLDARWQADAELDPAAIKKPECWKIQGCTPEQIENCEAVTSSLPCWQVYRLPNGYLHEECLSCEVFTNAPLPLLSSQPRRM